jgi:hypothetical protein
VPAPPCSWRWLSDKPLRVLVHQLVVGRHHQNDRLDDRFTGIAAWNYVRIHPTSPTLEQSTYFGGVIRQPLAEALAGSAPARTRMRSCERQECGAPIRPKGRSGAGAADCSFGPNAVTQGGLRAWLGDAFPVTSACWPLRTRSTDVALGRGVAALGSDGLSRRRRGQCRFRIVVLARRRCRG